MTTAISNSSPLNDSHALTASPETGCKHHTRNGRCRMPVADPLTSLCAEHARPRQKRDQAASLSAELIAGLTEFKSAVRINDFLSRLLLLQAQERISPRRAAVMAYTCNLLLRTLPAINLEQRIRIKPAKTRICSIFSPRTCRRSSSRNEDLLRNTTPSVRQTSSLRTPGAPFTPA